MKHTAQIAKSPSTRAALALLGCVSAVAYLLLAAGPASAAAPFEFGSFGSDAGQLKKPRGVAVAPAGDVYVVDAENNRVNKFDPSGHFLLAWGVGVADGAEELQTCTTECLEGRQTAIAGGFEFPSGVAVDGSGDVYVVDKGQHRIEKFSPQGAFILMFGGHVNKNGTDLCLAGEASECQAGTQTEGGEPQRDGEFSFWFARGNFIATGPGNKVYVGDTGRVQVFEPSGVWKEDISLAGLSSEGQPTSLAVDSAGDVFVQDSAAEGVREFEATTGIEKLTQFDKESSSVTALAVDPASGDLYVGDLEAQEPHGLHVLQYDPGGTELAAFGSNTVSANNRGLAFSSTTGELYADEQKEPEEGGEVPGKAGVWVLSSPPPGPVIEGEAAAPAPKGAAGLQATVNPEGNETTYHMEYVDQTHFQTTGYATAVSTAPVSVGSGPNPEERFAQEPAEAKLPEGTLVPGETYHWRVVATDSLNHTTTGTDQSFAETPSALVEGPWSEDVAATSATLAARIDPLGAGTSYRLEYGTSASYGHVLAGSAGAGEAYVPISYHLQELEASTTYHYRLLTSSLVGTVTGPDHSFATQPAGPGDASLPDGRAWELVSPASTGGAELLLTQAGNQAAGEGRAIVYTTRGEPLGEGAAGNNCVVTGDPVLSQRAAGGWRSTNICQLQAPPGPGEDPQLALQYGSYFLFSRDLAASVVEPSPFTSYSPEALPGTPYLRYAADASYAPLLTPANVCCGATTLFAEEQVGHLEPQVEVFAGTPDLGHLLLKSHLGLTTEAKAGETPAEENVYEWSGGRLRLVNILPNGEPTASGAEVAGGEGRAGTAPRSVSSDGRWVAWTRSAPYVPSNPYLGLYLRDMVEGKTVRLGGRSARYQTMSSDGSRVFFLERGDLYEYDTTTGVQSDLTAKHAAGEPSAGVLETISDVSEDGSYVYFVANGVLGDGAERGATSGGCRPAAPPSSLTCNLYLLHSNGDAWEEPKFVATLSSEDEHSWYSEAGTFDPNVGRVTSRVSPDGRFLTFMSQRSLTGYDNLDAVSGQPDVEVYLYDALTARLVCASCNPSGARPRGVQTRASSTLFVEHAGAGEWSEPGHQHWLAGSVPGWQVHNGRDTVYQPRYLSDSGRLFFDSPDALVAHDSNGLEDVYEYEPPGVGGCTTGSVSFHERSGGCVGLISSGLSSAESAFVDASESGEDVFFLSSDHLTRADADTGYDVWDAHVCSSASPCLTPPGVSPPACSSGDSCKVAPAAQPELFGPAPSATFSGPGNAAPAPPAISRPLTRAQKLAKALSTCRHTYKRAKRRRAACERSAHRRYGHAAKRAAKSAHANRKASR